MPTKRTRVARYSQADLRLNMTQKYHLLSGFYLIPGQPGFLDEDHRKACWQIHRDELIAHARSRGRVPQAQVEYEGVPGDASREVA
jgi:hypothetical protein